MSDKSIRYIVYSIKTGLFVLPVLALLVSDAFFFPFITTKNFFFRIMVEILFFLWVFVMVFDKRYRPRKSPLLLALAVTLFILVLAGIFGENPYRSFWSNYERMEGIVGHIHLFLYFLILTSIFQGKKDWKRFFGIMLGISFIATIYGFLQFFGKAAIHQSDVRLDATFGNATYLAIFLIFHLFLISLFLFWFRQKWLRISLGALFVLEAIVMFLTATRGAILGFLAGLFLFGLLMTIFASNKKLRYCFAALMIVLILTVGLFMLLKDQSFIRNNSVLARFASISFAEGTVESRFTIWGMSWQGFQEHPILGWGSENYNLVFNKYYQPKLWKQEPWFDRSHNIVFDWLISAGILGLLAYISIFVSALYMVWRRNALFESVVITSLFAAYSFHNLFVFDNLTSYFMFFSVLGYIHFSWASDKNPSFAKASADAKALADRSEGKEIGGLGYLAVTFSFLLVIFSLYFVNIRPLLANHKLLDSLYIMRQTQSVDSVLQKFDEVFKYNTFGTGEAREQLTGYANNILGSQAFVKQDKVKVLTKAIREMEKQIQANPDDVRYLIMMSALYNKAGMVDNALKTVNRAIELSPKKQQIYFVKTDIYLSAGQRQQALEVIKTVYELEPSYTEAAKNLAILYLLNNKQEEAEKILMKHFSKIIVADKQLINAYAGSGNYERVRDIWLEFVKREPNNAQYRVSLAATYLQLNEKEKAIEALQKAAELNPQFKKQAEYLISEIRAGRNP
jgi:O-antigen ligase/Flp pilus assembly protein TadD